MAMLPPDPLYIFKGDMGPVLCLMVKKSKVSHLYAGTQSGSVHVWNLKTNRQVGTFKASDESCLSIQSVDETSEIIVHDKMGVIRFWLEQDFIWTMMKEIVVEYYGFCKSDLFDGILYVPVKQAFIQGLSVKTKEITQKWSVIENGRANEIMCFRIFNAYNEILALVALESCDIYLYSLSKSKKLGELKVDECPMALEFDSSIMKGVCGCPTEKMLVFHVNKSFEMTVVRNVMLKNPGVASLSIRPDGRLLAVGCWDGKLRLYSMKGLSILAVLDIHTATIQDVLFFSAQHSEEKQTFWLVAASKDGKISLWDLYN